MRRLITVTALAAIAMLPTGAFAQTPDSVDGLGDVIVQLSRSAPAANQQRVLDDLFSGRIDATIVDADGNNGNFQDGDLILFSLRSISRGGDPLTFTGNRGAFDQFVDDNAEDILAILFPGSLTESTSGIDVAQGHSQSFLVSTALAAGGRGNIGGRIEYENFDVESSSGNSIQGLFRVRSIAVEARYAQLSDTLKTKATNVGVNYHPAYTRATSAGEWRVGGDGYFNVLYSTSRGLEHLGSLDYGAGVWASGRRSVGRTTLALGGILLGSKTHIPLALIDDNFDYIAEVINERPLRWDFTYGGSVQRKLTDLWTVGGMALQSASVKSAVADQGRTSQLLLANVVYLIGGDDALDFGYRYSTGGERFKAHGIFMNANFSF
jgi:hypothetical protein